MQVGEADEVAALSQEGGAVAAGRGPGVLVARVLDLAVTLNTQVCTCAA